MLYADLVYTLDFVFFSSECDLEGSCVHNNFSFNEKMSMKHGMQVLCVNMETEFDFRQHRKIILLKIFWVYFLDLVFVNIFASRRMIKSDYFELARVEHNVGDILVCMLPWTHQLRNSQKWLFLYQTSKTIRDIFTNFVHTSS